jgi:hypothetical protein
MLKHCKNIFMPKNRKMEKRFRMRTLRCENASPFGKNAFDTITLKSIKSYKKICKKRAGT